MCIIEIAAAVIVVDVGTVDPRERHSMVFDTFARLAPGQALELVSDHNPEPLLEEFVAELPDGFWWRRPKESCHRLRSKNVTSPMGIDRETENCRKFIGLSVAQ
ncbi:DUF2249 domain-containing protein [Burkholderia territorii]|uniref:DUF2249 domain-containing protein n=1 Tax=Burkholderia territorii TaxID=1503055 RepID=UPI0009BE4934|nr:DUF2249 domain-containing protein [Burkholderia territorii]